MTALPSYSVVITCHYESNSIDEFASRLIAACRQLGRPVEIIFVNDGSMDDTFAKLKVIFERQPIVSTVADLFRNAGQAAAMTAGITLARGDHFIFMDSDLQLDPEQLPEVVRRFEDGFDIVSGYRENRRDPLMRRVYSSIANKVMRRASRTTFRDFGCTYKIYDGKLIRAFRLGPFAILNTVQVMSRAGRYAEVPVRHHPRPYGKSGWTFGRLMDFNTEHLVNLSNRPFQYAAVAFALISTLLALRVAIDFIAPHRILPMVSSGLLLNALAIAALALASIQTLTGEYVLRAYRKLQGVPHYIIRELITRDVLGVDRREDAE